MERMVQSSLGKIPLKGHKAGSVSLSVSEASSLKPVDLTVTTYSCEQVAVAETKPYRKSELRIQRQVGAEVRCMS